MEIIEQHAQRVTRERNTKMGELKKQTVSGVKWFFVASITQRIISFGATVILARILSPSDFGLFALAMVMIDGFGIFKSLGFDSALVRRKDDINKACNTAFFLIPSMGMILFLILFITAPYVAKSFRSSSMANVMQALGIVFVISCFGKVPQTVLYRDMKFKYKSIAEVSASAAYSITAVILALNKLGVWSLVIAYILKTFLQISLEWNFSGWKPKLEFDKTIAWEMFHFGKYILASALVTFLYANSDSIIIGKMLGLTVLGYYFMARNASNLLYIHFLYKVGYVMYPAYSKIHENEGGLIRVMLKSLKYISLVVFPFGFGLLIFAPDVLRFVFGEKWLPATNALRILACTGILNSLGTTIWPIFLAKGESKAEFQVNVVQVAVFFLLVVPLAINLKLLGVCFAVLISTIISFCIGLIRVKQIIHVKLMKIFESIKPGLISSLLMVLSTVAIREVILSKFINLYNFLMAATLAGIIYLFAIYLMEKNILKDIREALI